MLRVRISPPIKHVNPILKTVKIDSAMGRAMALLIKTFLLFFSFFAILNLSSAFFCPKKHSVKNTLPIKYLRSVLGHSGKKSSR